MSDHDGLRADRVLVGCYCQRCERVRARNRRKAKQREMGQYALVPVGPYRKRLEEFKALGWTAQMLARRTGMNPSTLHYLAEEQPPGKKVRRETYAALMALPLEPPPADLVVTVPAVLVLRRYQALACLGWCAREVSRRTEGVVHERFMADLLLRIRVTPQVHVDASVYDAVDKVFRALCMTPAPPSRGATRARRTATREGWFPPLAWDDIDDLDEVPDVIDEKPLNRLGNHEVADYDEAAVLRALAGKPPEFVTHADRLEITRRALESGRTYNFLIRVAGVTKPDRYVRDLRARGWQWLPPEPEYLYESNGQQQRHTHHHEETA